VLYLFVNCLLGATITSVHQKLSGGKS